jgi:hypothetical protein
VRQGETACCQFPSCRHRSDRGKVHFHCIGADSGSHRSKGVFEGISYLPLPMFAGTSHVGRASFSPDVQTVVAARAASTCPHLQCGQRGLPEGDIGVIHFFQFGALGTCQACPEWRSRELGSAMSVLDMEADENGMHTPERGQRDEIVAFWCCKPV